MAVRERPADGRLSFAGGLGREGRGGEVVRGKVIGKKLELACLAG